MATHVWTGSSSEDEEFRGGRFTFGFLLQLERGGAGAVFAAAAGEGKEGFGLASTITCSVTGATKAFSAITGEKVLGGMVGAVAGGT